MAKSASFDSTGVRGIIKRGKYTLVNTLALVIKLEPEAFKVFEKYVHGIKAAYEKMGYGIPSEGMAANLPNTTEKISILKTGFIIAQANPSIDCL
jgi:hypothetical protein